MTAQNILFQKTIPVHLLASYINAGWAHAGSVSSDLSKVERHLFSSDGFEQPQVSYQWGRGSQLLPYSIKRPLSHYVGLPVEESVSPVDVLPPADLLSVAMRALQASYQISFIHKAPQICRTIGNSIYVLRIFGCFDTASQFGAYVEHLNNLYRSGQDPWFSAKNISDADMWWDIGSNCFLSFDKNYIHRLDSHLRHTFRGADL